MFKTIDANKSSSPCLICSRLVLAVTILCAAVAAYGQPIEVQDGIDPDKRKVLDRAAVEAARRTLNDADSGEVDSPDATPPSGKSGPGVPAPRRITGEHLAFEGTGGFSVKVTLSASVASSHAGYIVDAADDGHQDLAIMQDLRELPPGTHVISAACTDLYKSFPARGSVMASTPWSDDSSSHWAYWVRQAILRGRSNGYSFDEIQSSIWYITDRQGSADQRLLREINYTRSNPSKNASVSSDPPATAPLSTCGLGLPVFFAVACAWISGRKWRRNRSRT